MKNNFFLILLACAFPLLLNCCATTCTTDLLPGLLRNTPAALIPADSQKNWGTPQNPQKNGTIYDFMNGPGEIYLQHGFIQLLSRSFRDSLKRRINLELFVMQNSDSAVTLFSDARLRTSEERLLAIGDKGVEYNPVPNYIIDFIRDRFYVRISTDNDNASISVNQLAATIDHNITLLIKE